MCQMRLYNLGSEAYFKQKKYKEAREYCEKYLEYYEILKDKEEERVEQEAFFVNNAFEPSGLFSTLCYYILSDLYLGKLWNVCLSFLLKKCLSKRPKR